MCPWCLLGWHGSAAAPVRAAQVPLYVCFRRDPCLHGKLSDLPAMLLHLPRHFCSPQSTPAGARSHSAPSISEQMARLLSAVSHAHGATAVTQLLYEVRSTMPPDLDEAEDFGVRLWGQVGSCWVCLQSQPAVVAVFAGSQACVTGDCLGYSN